MKTIVQTSYAPAPIGPYSQAVWAGDLLFVSGQVPMNPETNEVILDNVATATHQVMKNIEAILAEAGLTFSNVVKTGIFLTDMDDFALVNEVYGSYFSVNYPARETVQVSRLPRNVSVEISVVALKY